MLRGSRGAACRRRENRGRARRARGGGPCGDRVRAVVAGVLPVAGAEDCHEPVAQELVDHAVVSDDGVHGAVEDRVEVGHDLLGAALLGERREPADVEEEHADLALLAPALRLARHQARRDLRRHVLAEDTQDARALLERLEGAEEAAAHATPDEARRDARREQNRRLREVLGAASSAPAPSRSCRRSPRRARAPRTRRQPRGR